MAIGSGVVQSGYSDFGKYYYGKKALAGYEEAIGVDKFAQMVDYPMHASDSITFFRFQKNKPTMTALAAGANPTTQARKVATLNVPLSYYPSVGGNDIDEESLKMSIVDVKNTVARYLGIEVAEGVETLVFESYVKRAWRMRIDGNTSGEFDSSATAAGTTTTMEDTVKFGLDYSGAIIVFKDGANRGFAARISSVAANVATFTPALPFAVASGDKYHLCINKTPGGDAIGAADTMTIAGMRRMRMRLKKNAAVPFPGGWYAGMLNPEVTSDIFSDTELQNLFSQGDSAKARIYNYEIGRYNNILWHEFSLVSRESSTLAAADFAFDADGAVHLAIAVGQDAYGMVKLRGENGEGPANFTMHVFDGVDSGNRAARFIGMTPKVHFGTSYLDAGFAAIMLCGSAQS